MRQVIGSGRAEESVAPDVQLTMGEDGTDSEEAEAEGWICGCGEAAEERF